MPLFQTANLYTCRKHDRIIHNYIHSPYIMIMHSTTMIPLSYANAVTPTQIAEGTLD